MGVCISRYEARTQAFTARWPNGRVSALESRSPGSNPASATGGERGGTARCGAVRCGAVRCGRLVQGGHGAGAARERLFFMRQRAAAIEAGMVGPLCAGFSMMSSVLSLVLLLSSATKVKMLTTLWPDALDCIVTRGGRSARARRAPARAARRGRAASRAASSSARSMVVLFSYSTIKIRIQRIQNEVKKGVEYAYPLQKRGNSERIRRDVSTFQPGCA